MTTVSSELIEVNGTARKVRLAPERSLLELLRDDLGLTAAKPGCGEGACGACTVLLDGEPVRACVTPAGDAAGRSVTTVEGLGVGSELHPVQAALVAEGAVQCGYCTPGMALAAVALLEREPDPQPVDIHRALAGNLCRCCAYPRIERAVSRAARAVREGVAVRPVDSALPQETTFWEFRPATPWDRSPVQQREYFELLGDGLVVVLTPGQRSPGSRPPGLEGGAWLHVGVDGAVTAFTGKVDVGQDNRTALSLIVAEELDAELGAVRLVMGDTDLCPFDMGTFGSRSLPDAGEDLRLCAASARRLLSSRPLAAGIRGVELASPEVTTKSPVGWKRAGRSVPRCTATTLVTGAHHFPSDLVRPGMLHGCILRPPAYGASLRSLDLERARGLPGATVLHEGDFVGAAAEDLATARRALDAIAAQWSRPKQPPERGLEQHLRAHPVEVLGWEGAVNEEEGDVERALEAAEVRLEATYTTAYLAHASLETRAAVAEWEDGRLTVWTGTQQPFFVRYELAAGLGIAEERVRVIVPDFGGGFGSKHTEDVALAAARLARAAGRPVKVALTREEEFRFTCVRPAAVIDVRSGADRKGTITALDFTNVNSGSAGLRSPYEIPNQRISFQPADSPLPQGPYRALAATANHFARESHVDELAHAVGLDPLELRLSNMADDRLAAVLAAAADRAGWDELRRRGSPGTGTGLACGVEKGGRVATVTQVQVKGRKVEILRVVSAYECGAIVNPDNVERQIEGATIMGLGGALFEAVHFDRGRILNATVGAYRLPRITDVPPIEVVLLDRPDLPSAGAGETPIIAVAPAVANAIFAATGRRLRALPLYSAVAAP
jgi:CO/xanthine dehydrogenase Mo-binding subunit/aerobic-type carbon monoxide dehydrogenase small subunit (CoxS/CutS family)